MLNNRINHLLALYEAQHLVRDRHLIQYRKGEQVINQSNHLINFCSNDYLQLSIHPTVIKAFINAASQFGLGSTASAIVSGYTKYHQLLEEEFANFLHREKALLFNSGYHANLGVLATFADRNSVIIADKFCHASLNDGALLSRARYLRFQHKNYQQAESLLKKYSQQETLLVSESIYSMQGDIADIKHLAELAKNYKKIFIVDDAHGFGVLGEHGRGAGEAFQLSEDNLPCLITPLGKSLGSMGAIVSGKRDLIETLLQFARTYHYSTALPPAVCSASLAALKLLEKDTWRQHKLRHLIHFFIKEARERELPLSSDDITPIKSIIIGANKLTFDIRNKLINDGFLVAGIRPPSVAKDQACIRISLNCMHNENQIRHLLDRLKDYHAHLALL